MNQSEIESLYKCRSKALDKAIADLKSFREEYGDQCQHSLTFDSSRQCDNGYGKWWTVKYKICSICLKRKSEYSSVWRKND